MGEEAVELVIKQGPEDKTDLFKKEADDLIVHYLILLSAKNVSLIDIEKY